MRLEREKEEARKRGKKVAQGKRGRTREHERDGKGEEDGLREKIQQLQKWGNKPHQTNVTLTRLKNQQQWC